MWLCLKRLYKKKKKNISNEEFVRLETPKTIQMRDTRAVGLQLSCKLGAMRSPIWPAPSLMTKRCPTVFLCRRGWGWMSDGDCWCVILTLAISSKVQSFQDPAIASIIPRQYVKQHLLEMFRAIRTCFTKKGWGGVGGEGARAKVNYSIVCFNPNIRLFGDTERSCRAVFSGI